MGDLLSDSPNADIPGPGRAAGPASTMYSARAAETNQNGPATDATGVAGSDWARLYHRRVQAAAVGSSIPTGAKPVSQESGNDW